MADSADNNRRTGVSRRRFLQGAAGGAAYLAGGSLIGRMAQAQAQAAGANVIVDENRLPGNTDFQISFPPPPEFNRPVVGFAPQTSVNRGESVPIKLISYRSAATPATIKVFRLGYYGGAGSRLVHTENVVALPNFADQGDGERPPGNFGLRSFSGWTAFQAVPASATQVSGVYLVKVSASGGPGGQPDETHIPFVVRDDDRARDLLVVMPTNTWQAYNGWPQGSGKSLYSFNSSSEETVAGLNSDNQSRAVKVSFDRPYTNIEHELNWVLRTEFPLIWWLERQGYDLSYTDDYGMHTQPEQLRRPQTKTLAIAGHGEYWTKEMFDNVEAARNAGTNIASFSANAAYWKVRYEDAGRTLVCFKTVGGRDAATGGDAGADGVNDFGPGTTARGGPNDPLGAEGQAGGTGVDADKPEFATTTFRDGGAAVGASGAPDGDPPRAFEGRGRVGPDRPENSLWGLMYVGGHYSAYFPLQVPGGTGPQGGEFAAHPAWRHTTLANPSRPTARVGQSIIGWEWDAMPQGSPGDPYGRYVPRQPAGVKRLAQTNIQELNSELPAPVQAGLEYLVDEGRTYNRGPSAQPAPGQDHSVHAVTYRDPQSGALVFSAGTMQWAWGLGPHFETRSANRTYEDPRIDVSDPNIQQATYNILADGGVNPATPDGLVLDSDVGGTQPPPVGGSPQVALDDKTPPKLTIHGGRKVMGKGGLVRVRVTCPREQRSGCFATVTLVAEIPRTTSSGRRRKPRRIKLGAKRVDLRAGQSKVLSFRLSKEDRRRVLKRKRVRIVVEAQVSDIAGNTAGRTGAFRLYATRRSMPRTARRPRA